MFRLLRALELFFHSRETIRRGNQTSTAHSTTPDLKEKVSPHWVGDGGTGWIVRQGQSFWLSQKGFPFSVLFGQTPGCIWHRVLMLITAPSAYFALHFHVKNFRFPNHPLHSTHPHPVSLYPDPGSQTADLQC